MAYKKDTAIIGLFSSLKQKNDTLISINSMERTNENITEIKDIIENIKELYIVNILNFDNCRYKKEDLNEYSITKLQEIYINYYKYKNKCNIIKYYADKSNNYRDNSILSLLVALFNKKNYILSKLFNENNIDDTNIHEFNVAIEKLNNNIRHMFANISIKNSEIYTTDFNFLEDILGYFYYLIQNSNLDANLDAILYENIKYLFELNIFLYFEFDQTNIYNFLYLIQDKLMKFPKNICKSSNNDVYNNKIFYNISYDIKILDFNNLNSNKKLQLNVLLEDGKKTQKVVIEKIPLIFLNINKKYNAKNEINIFLDTIYNIYENFTKLFDNVNNIN